MFHEGLVFFNNPKTDKFLSISGDRIFIIIRDLLNRIKCWVIIILSESNR